MAQHKQQHAHRASRSKAANDHKPHAADKVHHLHHSKTPTSSHNTHDLAHSFFEWPTQIFHQVMQGWMTHPWMGLFPLTAWTQHSYSGKHVLANIEQHEDEKAYYYEVALPGVMPEQLSLSIRNGMVLLTAEETKHANHKSSHHYFIRSARRAFSLPVYTDGNGIKAKLEDGFLTITIPKSEAPVPPHSHHIAIHS